MKYFDNITTFEQSKQQYRKLAKQLHPDRGGCPQNFKEMQAEYKALLLKLNNKELVNSQSEYEKDIINELDKLAKAYVQKKLPRLFLEHRILKSKTTLEKSLYSGIIRILDEFNTKL